MIMLELWIVLSQGYEYENQPSSKPPVTQRVYTVACVFCEFIYICTLEESGILIEAAKRIIISKPKGLLGGIIPDVSDTGKDQQQPIKDYWV